MHLFIVYINEPSVKYIMHLFIVYINEPSVVYVQLNVIVAYLFSFGVETDYVHFDLNGDLDLNFHS